MRQCGVRKHREGSPPTITMNQDVLRLILDHSSQSDVASFARASRWFHSVAAGGLYANPHTSTMNAALLLCQRLYASHSDASIKGCVNSLEFNSLGATDVCSDDDWEMLENMFALAVKSPACNMLERIKLELWLPTATNERPPWGNAVWDALRAHCPTLQHVHLVHNNALQAELPPVCTRSFCANLIINVASIKIACTNPWSQKPGTYRPHGVE